MALKHLSMLLIFAFAVGHEGTNPGLHVHGPAGPVVAQLGGSVLLPCFGESPLPLEGLQVEWRKMDSDAVVSLFQQGESRPDLQSQEFRGRADFFPDELSKGNFSILLSDVVKNDSGGFRCQVNASRMMSSSEAIITIQDIKHSVVTEVTHAVFAHEGEDVVLNCSIDSHVPVSEIEEVTWKKTERDQNILVLLYQDSEIFPDSSHERYQGRVDLFPSEIPKGNFSLKLMDVRMEDNGEFMCEVHTGNISARNVVVLQGIGFSAVHISVLVLCFVALLLAVGLGVPAFNNLRTKVNDGKGMMMHASLILWPNICMGLAFGLWSTEGRLSKIVTCSAVIIARPVMLMKAAPYLHRLRKCVQRSVMHLAVPLYYSIIYVAACSLLFDDIIQTQTAFRHIKTVLAVMIVVLSVISALILAKFNLRIYSTVCLETLNGALLALFLHQRGKDSKELCSKDSKNSACYENILIPASLPPLVMALMLVLFLQKHYFKAKPSRCLQISLASSFVTFYSLCEMILFVLIGFTMRDFARLWIFPLEAVMYITAWLAVIFLSQNHKQGCCSQQGRIGYLCCSVIVLFIIIAFGALCFHFATIILVHTEDYAGGLALIVLAHVVAATSLFKHPKHSPGFLHIIIYMFGSVGLVIMNSIVLVVELILKAGKGARVIGDLSVIVLTLETVFISTWLGLQIYDAWRHLKDGLEERREPEVLSEMEILSKQPS